MGRHYSTVVAGLAVALSGCLLDTEICGPDFVEQGGRCVPASEPPPFRVDQADAGPGAPADAGATDGPPAAPDRGPPDAELPPHSWAEYPFIVVVDRTPADLVRRTPRTPGVDVDAIAHGPEGDLRWASEVVDWFLIDGPNASTDPQAVVGPPRDRSDPRQALSLGGEGGYVAVPNELGRPFTWGDQIEVHLQTFDGAQDSLELFLCREVPISSRTCLSVGASRPGVEVFSISAERR